MINAERRRNCISSYVTLFPEHFSFFFFYLNRFLILQTRRDFKSCHLKYLEVKAI